MEFFINRSTEYIDLEHSYLEMTLQLANADGVNITAAENMHPGQNVAHTLIKQISVYFNGVLISP